MIVSKFEECVNVTSPELKSITPPEAKKKSAHPVPVTPNAAPSFADGLTALSNVYPLDCVEANPHVALVGVTLGVNVIDKVSSVSSPASLSASPQILKVGCISSAPVAPIFKSPPVVTETGLVISPNGYKYMP